MKILVGHNHYANRGGEDTVFERELKLLRNNGNEVEVFVDDNNRVANSGFLNKFGALVNLGWSKSSFQKLDKILAKFKPDLAHFQNIFYLLTPSVYDACIKHSVPIVQSIHNFRFTCVNGLFYRGGQTCEECLEHNFWRGVKHRCYNNSYLQSFLISRILEYHKQHKTWSTKVDGIISTSEFNKKKMIAAGFPLEKIYIKPNFAYQDPDLSVEKEDYALYLGRLSDEKGVKFLMQGWKGLKQYKLKIAGDGPLKDYVRNFVKENNLANIDVLGHCQKEDCKKLLSRANFLVVPSACYENCPMAVLEAYSVGTPVLATDIGSLPEFVSDASGALFVKEDIVDFKQKALELINNPAKTKSLGQNAYKIYKDNYAVNRNYGQLMEIYNSVLESRNS